MPCKRQRMIMKKNTEVKLKKTLRRNFYVDDCLRSVSTKAKAKDQINGLHQACSKGGFHLTKFICNRRGVLESIPEEEQSKDVNMLDLNYDDLPIERAVGVQWCVKSDMFKFCITVKDKPVTKRGILSIVGFAAPFTLAAKKRLQDLCREERPKWAMNFLRLSPCIGKSGKTNYHCSST